MKKIFIGTFLVFAGIFSTVAQNLMQTLAVVKYSDSETVTLKEVKDIVDNEEKSAGRKLTPKERELAYETVIEQKLILQAAKKAGVTVQTSEVDQMFLQNIAQQMGLPRIYTEKELNDLVQQEKKMSFAQFLKEETGMTVDEVKNKVIRPGLLGQRYILMENQAELQKVAATDKEIRDYYELNKANFTRPDMLKLFIIAVPKQDNPGAKAKIESLLADLKSGKTNIEKLRKDGADPKGSGFGSGDGYVMKTPQHAIQMGITSQRLFAMFDEKLNTPSEIIENEQAYQFYVILEKYPFKNLELSDTMRPDMNQTIYETIRGSLTNQKQMQFLAKAQQDMIKVLKTPENVQRKKTGADLTKVLSW